MPRLPGVQNVGQVGTQRLRLPAIRAPQDNRGRALEQAGKQAFEINERMVEAKRRTDLTSANATASRQLRELEFGFNEDPDFATFNERFGDNADAIRDEVSDGINDSAVRSAFLAQFEKSRLNSEFKVRTLARNRQIDTGQGQLTRDVDTFAELLAGASNDLERQDIRQQAILALSDAADTGLITQKDRASRELAFLNKADTLKARREMRADPDSFVAKINDEREFVDLTEESRQRLSEQGSRLAATRVRDRVRLADRAERREDKTRKEAQELHAAGLRSEMLETPKSVTEERLVFDLQRRKITLSQFELLRRGLKAEEEGVDDPNVLLTLTADTIEADPTVPARVFAAREVGLLKAETARQILQRHESVLRSGGVLATNEVKRARAFVNDTVGGVRGPFSVLDSEASTRLAGAMREFDDRVLNGEKPFEVADDVSARFRLTDPGITSLPRPRFLVGTRSDPDLEATMRNTVERFEAGELTDEEFAKEAELLKLYEEVKDQKAKRQERLKDAGDRKR